MGNCKCICYQKSLTVDDSNNLMLLVRTCSKEGYSLFDYEKVESTREQTFNIANEGYLIKDQCIQWSEQIHQKYLLHIEKQNDIYYLRQTNKKRIWRVINKIQLHQGDNLKLGRLQLTLKVLRFQRQEESLLDSRKSSLSESQSCRVCCLSTESVKNPLVNPCQCNGSIKFIHLECLKTWLRMKFEISSNDKCTIYQWKQLECELCNHQFSRQIQHQQESYDLCDMCKPTHDPCIVLEKQDKQSSDNLIFVVKISECINVGRSSESDIILNDISVSREHAQFIIENEQLYIQDMHSKFGTLQQIQNDYTPLDHGLQIQVGKTFITFQ